MGPGAACSVNLPDAVTTTAALARTDFGEVARSPSLIPALKPCFTLFHSVSRLESERVAGGPRGCGRSAALNRGSTPTEHSADGAPPKRCEAADAPGGSRCLTRAGICGLARPSRCSPPGFDSLIVSAGEARRKQFRVGTDLKLRGADPTNQSRHTMYHIWEKFSARDARRGCVCVLGGCADFTNGKFAGNHCFRRHLRELTPGCPEPFLSKLTHFGR